MPRRPQRLFHARGMPRVTAETCKGCHEHQPKKFFKTRMGRHRLAVLWAWAMAIGTRGLGAAELEVEAPNLKLLVWIRSKVDVLLHSVILVGLDDRQPGQVFEE